MNQAIATAAAKVDANLLHCQISPKMKFATEAEPDTLFGN
jgi:hypothetical protein